MVQEFIQSSLLPPLVPDFFYHSLNSRTLKLIQISFIKMQRSSHWSLATDERYNDGIGSGHMWNDKRTMQTQRNMVVE